MKFHEFYQKLYHKTAPRPGELVVGIVQNIKEAGVYIRLEEYDKIAFVPLKEVAHSIPRNIRDVVKENQQVIAKVYSVKYGGEIINASLRRVTGPERQRKLQDFRRLKRVYMIFQKLAEKLKIGMNELIEKFGRPLVERTLHPYAGLEAIVRGGKEILKELGVPKEWHDTIYEFLKANIKLPEYTLRKELKILSLAPDAIIKIKKTLNSLMELAPGKIHIHYISAPRYELRIIGHDPSELESMLTKTKEILVQKLLRENPYPTIIEIDGERLRKSTKGATR